MLEDLVAAAVNATVKRVDETAEAEMGKLTGDLNIPWPLSGRDTHGLHRSAAGKLSEQFSQFPGIGRKGATRMAYQVLSMVGHGRRGHWPRPSDAATPAPPLPRLQELHRGRALPHLFPAPGGPSTITAWSDAAMCRR